MPNLLSTKDIIVGETYYNSPETFFSNFSGAWKLAISQVLKLETRQEYLEGNDPSFKLLQSGKLSEAIFLLKQTHNGDKKLYDSLKERKIDFIRCRPVIFPLTNYLRWEFEAYKINIEDGERIYCIDKSEWNSISENLAFHDFMVFDTSVAFIHDYDAAGEIKGGWEIKDKYKIENLIFIYSLIRAHSIEFSVFLKKNDIT